MAQRPGEVPRSGGELTLADLAGFLQRRWKLITGAALSGGVLVAVVVAFLVPSVWEASATVAIVPPTFSSELKPGALTVQGYQQLLESAGVVEEARKSLMGRGLLSADDRLEVGEELRSRIFVSRGAEEMPLAPLVQAAAKGSRASRPRPSQTSGWKSSSSELTS